MYEFLKKLEIAVPFIYRLNDEYYYFGATICRKCSKKEIAEYKMLKQEYELLKNLPHHPEPRDTEKFNQLFDAIISVYTLPFSNTVQEKAKNDIWAIIKYFSDSQKLDFEEQLRQREEMYNYRVGKHCNR